MRWSLWTANLRLVRTPSDSLIHDAGRPGGGAGWAAGRQRRHASGRTMSCPEETEFWPEDRVQPYIGNEIVSATDLESTRGKRPMGHGHDSRKRDGRHREVRGPVDFKSHCCSQRSGRGHFRSFDHGGFSAGSCPLAQIEMQLLQVAAVELMWRHDEMAESTGDYGPERVTLVLHPSKLEPLRSSL